MRVLGIETSCDETGVAVYDSTAGLMAHAVYSQIEIHAQYGGRGAGTRLPRPCAQDPAADPGGVGRGWARRRGYRWRRLYRGSGADRRPDGGLRPGPQPGLGLGGTGHWRAPHGGPPAGAPAGGPGACLPLRRPPGLRRPHPTGGRGGGRTLPHPRRVAGRRGRRGLRQDRQDSRTPLPRRAGTGAAGAARRPRTLPLSRGP